MTVTINLPQNVEQAYLSAAQSKGVSVAALLTDVLVSHVPATESALRPELVEERGVPVLRTGHPLDPSMVDDILDAIRRERLPHLLPASGLQAPPDHSRPPPVCNAPESVDDW